MLSNVKPKSMTWASAAKKTWTKGNDDDVLGRSAQLAYYFFLALFPMLIFMISALGIIPGAGEQVRMGLTEFLRNALPASASELIQKTMTEVTSASGFGKMSFGVIFALWSASAGMAAIMDTLNEEHGVKEGRSFVKQKLVAVGLTLAVATLMLGAVGIIIVGGSQHLTSLMSGGAALAWKAVQWPVAAGFVLLSFATIYYFAPDMKDAKWHWITPGAVVGVALWLIASFGLRIYLHFFNSYSATYGSLGAVIILLLSFYLTGIAILYGNEVNVVLEQALLENKSGGLPATTPANVKLERPEARSARAGG